MADQHFKKIQQVLKFVWDNPYSSFYRDKYRKVGVRDWRDVRTSENFQKLPFLNRDEIVKVDLDKLIFFPDSEISNIVTSSGTTSQSAPLILYKRGEFSKDAYITESRIVQIIKKLKIKNILFLHSILYNNRLTSFSPIYKNFCVVLGDPSNLPLTARICAKVKIQALRTTPTILDFFTPHLKEVSDLKKIRFISLGSEFCSKTHFQLFKKLYPNATFSFRIGSAETQGLGIQCDFLPEINPSLFHWTKYNFPEVIDLKTNQNLGLYNQGELIVTTLFKDIFPLIRYKTGNLVVFKKERCQCGSSDPLFEMVGRAEFDTLKIQGTTIHVKNIDEALSKVADLIKNDYQMHVYEQVLGNKIVVQLVLEVVKNNPSLDERKIEPVLVDKISHNLYLSARVTLKDLVEKKVFSQLQIKFVDQLPYETKRRHIIPHFR